MNTPNTAPKNFLLTTWEGGGTVAPMLTVARKLKAQGHRIRVMCDEVAREETESQGLEFRSWSTAPNRRDRNPENCFHRDWEAPDPQEGVQRMLDAIMLNPSLEYANDVIAELETEAADLVITSEILIGVMAACESRKQPFAALTANLCFYPLPGMPAFGPGLPPPKTAEETVLHEQIKAGTSGMLDKGLETFNKTRATLGLSALDHVADQLDTAGLILIGTSRAFDFPGNPLPEKVHYVGPQLDEPAWTQEWKSHWDTDDTRPLILVGFSTTFQNHTQVLQKIIDAAENLPVRLLVTLGQIKKTELRQTENAVLVESAPHDAVMKDASFVVTHGGHGTVMRALMHKLPMLVVPHGRDQGENAIRITERGVGICLPAESDSLQFREVLEQLIDEDSFTEAAANLGSAIASGSEDDSVVTLIENLSSHTCKHTGIAV